jgi:PIN domain nuclease of toxin-antitoxin system
MNALLDTHAFLWWLDGDPSLSERAFDYSERAFDYIAREEGAVLVSASSAWEIATKHRLGKLPRAGDVAVDVAGCIDAQRFRPLSVTVAHGQRAGALPGIHRDPFDRMLIAQAIMEDCVLISNEAVFERYGVTRLW